jgi:hypothetical protein
MKHRKRKEFQRTLTRLNASQASVAETLLATAVAVAVLEKRFADLKEEWTMLADKAIRYIRSAIKKVSPFNTC